jgi:hypothetical protein
MNVRRGLFRAWIVVSVLWIGAVMLFAPRMGIGVHYMPLMEKKPAPEIKASNAPNFYDYFYSPSAEDDDRGFQVVVQATSQN